MRRRPRTIGDSDRWWKHHRQGGNRTSFKRSSAAAILRKSRYQSNCPARLPRLSLAAMTFMRKLLITLLVIVLVLGVAIFWILRGESAEVPFDQVTGTDPLVEEAEGNLIPTVRIAKPVGWPDGAVPAAAEGLAVGRFAEGLDHPRVIHALPNGDVLVALTRQPAKQAEGFMGWIENYLMKRAGATGP